MQSNRVRMNGLTVDDGIDLEQEAKRVRYKERVSELQTAEVEEQALIIDKLLEKNGKLKALIAELEDEIAVLSIYRPANILSLSSIPEHFGDTDAKKLTKALSYLKKNNLIITK